MAIPSSGQSYVQYYLHTWVRAVSVNSKKLSSLQNSDLISRILFAADHHMCIRHDSLKWQIFPKIKLVKSQLMEREIVKCHRKQWLRLLLQGACRHLWNRATGPQITLSSIEVQLYPPPQIITEIVNRWCLISMPIHIPISIYLRWIIIQSLLNYYNFNVGQ